MTSEELWVKVVTALVVHHNVKVCAAVADEVCLAYLDRFQTPEARKLAEARRQRDGNGEPSKPLRRG